MVISRTLVACLALVLSLTACLGVDVSSDYSTGTDFSAYQSFAWMDQPFTPSASPVVSEFVVERIRTAVENDLVSKGLTKVEQDAAQMLVAMYLSVQDKVQVNDPYFAHDQYQYYEEGTLVLDFVDAGTKQLVWRGTGQGRIRNLKTPEERQARIQEVVDAILAQYPPKPGDKGGTDGPLDASHAAAPAPAAEAPADDAPAEEAGPIDTNEDT